MLCISYHTEKNKGIKEARHKRAHTVWVHLYEVQEHTNRIESGGGVWAATTLIYVCVGRKLKEKRNTGNISRGFGQGTHQVMLASKA